MMKGCGKLMTAAISAALLLAGLALHAGPDNKYWSPTDGDNWSTDANWTPDGVPGSSHVAVFDGNTSSTDCTINANANVAGIRVTNDYSGVITQGPGRTITIGAEGFAQHSGTFSGNDADITINTASFTLAGGTFTSTSGMLQLLTSAGDAIDYWTHSGGTFEPNGGLVLMQGGRKAVTEYAGQTTFHDLMVSRSHRDGAINMTPGSTITVENTLTLEINRSEGTLGGYSFNTGKLICKGDIVLLEPSGDGYSHRGNAELLITGSNNQVLNSEGTGIRLATTIDKPSGTVEMTGNWEFGSLTLASGTVISTSNTLTIAANPSFWTNTGAEFIHNNGTVNFGGGIYNLGNCEISVDGTETFYNLTLDLYRPDFDIALNDTILVIGKLELLACTLNGGGLEARGDMTINVQRGGGGASPFFLTGANAQKVTHIAGTPPRGDWTIDKSGGSVVLATDLELSGSSQNLLWEQGGLNLSSNTLTVAGAVSIAEGATILGVTVADATTAGRLKCNSPVSGIDNAGLEVTVTATMEEVEGQIYLILSNTETFQDPFAFVKWLDGWNGDVAYTVSEGKDVTLSNLRYGAPGTLLLIR